MPVKIYWGPPGSYKTASAVWDDVTECAKQGRVLITNVRGLTEGKCAEFLKDVKEGFRVIHLAMDRPDDMAKLRRWWHWAPFGAYFVLDEVQAIYPPFWSSKQMRELDAEDSERRNWPSGEQMPREMEIAFDMHRHGNWDFTFTTPNIKKVRPEIRAAAEWAYKHRNLAYIGFLKGSYMEFQHNAEDNGNPSDIFTARRRKVPPHVFQLYSSTATGSAKDSSAGVSIFKSPYFLFLAAGITSLVVFAVTRDAPAALQAAYGVKKVGAPIDRPHDFRLDPQELRSNGQLDQTTNGSPSTNVSKPAEPAKPEGPSHSNTWRLLGVLSKEGTPGIALLANAAARRRVTADTCVIVDHLNEWECLIDGELVTRWTGSDIISEQLGSAKPAQL